MKNYIEPGEVIEVTAPGGGVTVGKGVQIGHLVGIATITAAAAAKFNLAVTGVFDVDKVSAQAWAEGDPIYWDTAAALFTTVALGNRYAGTAVAAAADPSATGRLWLNAPARAEKRLITIALPTNGALADGAVFIADRAYRVLGVSEIHAVAGNDAGAVTLDVKKQTGTQDPTQGVSVLAATFNLKAAANTVVRKDGAGLTATAADKALAKDNRLSLDFTGTLTAVAGLAVTIELETI